MWQLINININKKNKNNNNNREYMYIKEFVELLLLLVFIKQFACLLNKQIKHPTYQTKTLRHRQQQRLKQRQTNGQQQLKQNKKLIKNWKIKRLFAGCRPYPKKKNTSKNCLEIWINYTKEKKKKKKNPINIQMN